MEKMEECISKLKSSPLFNLSLASKELFHSNFLAWVLEEKDDQARILLHELAGDKDFDLGTLEVKREENNFDLTLLVDDQGGKKYRVVIENKVKSIPTSEQLDRYSTKLIKKVKGVDETLAILLSLTPPDFFDAEGLYKPVCEAETLVEWRHLGYDTVLRCLGQEGCKDPYHRALLDDYREFTQALSDLVNSILSDERYFPVKEVDLQIEELRIHDLIRKGQAFSVAQILQRKYPEGVLGLAEKSPGSISIEHGFLKGTSLVSLYKCFNGHEPEKCYFAGVQVDGDSLRICGYAPCRGPKDRRAEKFMKYLYETVFKKDVTFTGATNKRKNAYCEPYLQYQDKTAGKSVGMFLYKRKTIEPFEIEKNTLAEEMDELFQRVLEFENDLQQKILTGYFER